jgi:iron complex transport system substrate-binding protein
VRVVSLLPSATEIVAALGGFEHLVGVTHECDWPSVVASRARVTTSVIDSSRSSAEIDGQVRQLSGGGEALYSMKERLISDLRPDVILTQALCDVCAIHEGDVRTLAASLGSKPRVVTLSAETLEGVFEDIARVGDAIDLAAEANELASGLRAQLRDVHLTLKNAAAPRPRVAVVEWTEPLFTGGHWIPDMIHRAGGIDPIGKPGERSRVMTLDDLRSADPEVIVFAPCGFGLERATAEATRTLQDPAWQWAAERSVWAIDANSFMSRPGPRLVEGVEILARMFNAALFSTLESSHAVRLHPPEPAHVALH